MAPPAGHVARALAYVTGAGLAAGALAAVWGVGIEPCLIDQTEQVARIPGLPPPWWDRRVAFMADFQVGGWLDNAGTVRRAVARVVRERPALALIGGDIVYQAVAVPPRAIPRAIDLLRPLAAAGIPTFAVLGNHDYGLETGGPTRPLPGVGLTLTVALEEIGIRVLTNEAVPLAPPPGAVAGHGGEVPLYLVGIDDHMSGEDRPRRAVAEVPAGAPRLVFMHDPASFAPLPPGSAPFAVAGHTHGGQIRLPFFPRLAVARLYLRWPQYRDGWIEGYGQRGNRLYVNRGIGFSHIPVRFGCRPEVTFFTLTPA